MTLPIIEQQIRESYLAHERAEELKQFKEGYLLPGAGAVLHQKRAHVSGGHSHEKHDRQQVPLRRHQWIDIITNQNLTHDTTLVFHTNGKGVNDALKMGQLNPQALTSKAIKALGKYRQKVVERRVKSRIESELTNCKIMLLQEAQERIEQLQDLELRLGHRIYPHSASAAAEQMMRDLAEYIGQQKLSRADQEAKAIGHTGSHWEARFHAARIHSLELVYEENRQAALELQALIFEHQGDAEWLQTTGNEEILAFLKERIICGTRQMQAVNQALTHQHGSGAYLRGDLNSCAEDAIKLTRDFAQDFHTPLTRDHQLRYDPNQRVIIDSDFHTDGSVAQLEELMMAVSEISGDHEECNLFLRNLASGEGINDEDRRAAAKYNRPILIRQNGEFRLYGDSEGNDHWTETPIGHLSYDQAEYLHGLFRPGIHVIERSDARFNPLLIGLLIRGHTSLSLSAPRGPLQRHILAAKWRHWRSFYDFNKPYESSVFTSGRRFGGWLWSVLWSPFNLIETTLRGDNAEVVEKIIQIFHQPEDVTERVQGKTDYYALIARLNKQTSISTKIGLELYKVVNYLFVEGIWRGLTDGWKQIKRLPENVYADFQNPERELQAILLQLKYELKEIEKEDQEILGCDLVLIRIPDSKDADEDYLRTLQREHPNTPILVKHSKGYILWGNHNGAWCRQELSGAQGMAFNRLRFEEKTNKAKLIKKGDYQLTSTINRVLKLGHNLDWRPQPNMAPRAQEVVGARGGFDYKEEKNPEAAVHAEPKVSLQPYASRGIANGGASGFIEFIDLFGHNMAAKHPFTFAASSVGAVVSFLAFFTPAFAVQVFGKGYVKFLQDQGYIWAKDTFSASLAGSFTNFKLVGAIIEGLEHGPDSWANKVFGHLLNDPAKTVTYISLAWAIGHALVYLIDVPYLSEELRNHIGDPAAFSEVFGGAKLGLIGYHLFADPHGNHEEARKDYIDECVANYRALLVKHRVPEGEAQQILVQVRAKLEELLSPKNLEATHGQVEEALAQARTPTDKDAENTLALMLQLAANKEHLSRLPVKLKVQLQYFLEKSVSSVDATAIDKLIDPERYAPKSTLRSFLGRTIGYVPTLVRCALSPLAAVCLWVAAGAPFNKRQLGIEAALGRPWKELGSMLLDDVTSTTFAVFRVANKIMESAFNRFPRTVADIVVNGILARTLSFFGFHDFTLFGYRQSAKADCAQLRVCEATTGGIMTYLARKNTAPHAEVGLSTVLSESMSVVFKPLPAKLSALPLLVSAQGGVVVEEEKVAIPPEPSSASVRLATGSL